MECSPLHSHVFVVFWFTLLLFFPSPSYILGQKAWQFLRPDWIDWWRLGIEDQASSTWSLECSIKLMLVSYQHCVPCCKLRFVPCVATVALVTLFSFYLLPYLALKICFNIGSANGKLVGVNGLLFSAPFSPFSVKLGS